MVRISVRDMELLQLNIEDLDLAGRCARVKSKGAKPRTRRRGAAHHEHVLETVYWDAGTARLLPRLIRGRTRGPVFVTHRRPGPGKYLADRDLCPDTGTCTTVLRPGPRPARRRHRHRRARHRLGPARTPALRPDTPRRIRREPARTHGQIAAPQGREPAPLLQTLTPSHARTHQPHRPRHLPHPLTSHYAISAQNSADTTATPLLGTDQNAPGHRNQMFPNVFRNRRIMRMWRSWLGRRRQFTGGPIH